LLDHGEAVFECLDVAEVDTSQRQSGRRGVHVGIDEGWGDQRAAEVYDLIDPVGQAVCGIIRPDPGDLAIGHDHRRRERVDRTIDVPAAIQRGGG